MRGLACAAAAAVLAAVIFIGGAGAQSTSAPRLGRILGIVPALGKAATAQGLGKLSYHGGPTMTTNKTYAIYWIPSGYSVSASYTTLINRFLAETNDDPRPFNWTADPDRIIAAVRRGHQTLDSLLRARLERKVGRLLDAGHHRGVR